MVGITNVISVSYFCLILENVLGFPALPCLSHIVSSNLHFCLCYLLFAIDPTFISSTFIPDEEKIYFFFTEVGREYDFIDKFIVSRVSQICVVSWNDGARLRTVQRDSAKIQQCSDIWNFLPGTNKLHEQTKPVTQTLIVLI